MGSTSDLRNSNTSSLLQALLKHGQLARFELADLTGLTRTSVTNVVAELVEGGIVQETERGKASSQGGRKPIMLELCADALTVIGIDLRRERITGCLVDLKGNVSSKCSFPLELGCTTEAVLEKFDRVVHQLRASTATPIVGIGLGSVGPLDKPLDFNAIQEIDLRSELENRYGLPVVIEAGATAAAIGEYFWTIDDASRLRSLVFIEIDYRVGMGIVAGNRVWDAGGKGISIGHMTIDPSGEPCVCGRAGCLDVYASGKTLLQKMDDASFGSSVTDLSTVAERAEKGDQAIQSAIFDMADPLIRAFINLDWLLHPERIVIGSSHDQLNKWYLTGIREYLADNDITSDGSLLERLSLATHGSYAIAYGAATMQLKVFFESPQLIVNRTRVHHA